MTGENSRAEIAPTPERAGERIGRYKLLQPIGEGGYGVFFVAEQEESVRRRVALRVMKLGRTRGKSWPGSKPSDRRSR